MKNVQQAHRLRSLWIFVIVYIYIYSIRLGRFLLSKMKLKFLKRAFCSRSTLSADWQFEFLFGFPPKMSWMELHYCSYSRLQDEWTNGHLDRWMAG